MIVCFNFALPQGLELRDKLAASGVEAALFTVHPTGMHDWTEIAGQAARAGRLYLLDDGKEAISPAHELAHRVLALAPNCRVTLAERGRGVEYATGPDLFDPFAGPFPPAAGERIHA